MAEVPERSMVESSAIARFDEETGPLVSRVSRLTKRVGRLMRMPKLTQDLNVVDASRLLRDTQQAVSDLQDDLRALSDSLAATALGVNSGDEEAWAQEFEQALADIHVPFQANYPIYQVFPFEIRVDLTNATATVNNRLTHVMRPESLARIIQRERDRLYAAKFNDRQFMKGLVRVWDLVKGGETRAGGVPLRQAHEILSLRTGPSGYSLQQFAFDLYRLRYQSTMTYEGKRFRLNAARNSRGAVQVPHPNGSFDNLGSFEVVEVDA